MDHHKPAEFHLHPQLLADCHCLGRLPGAWLLLQRNAALPWLILVPETASEDFLSLPPAQRSLLLEQSQQLAEFLRGELGAERINFASIGNLVPQLHLHIVGRHAGDACWPKPVWGHLAEGPSYSAGQVQQIQTQLAARCGLSLVPSPADRTGETDV
ncbi:MAG: HIT family protein [Gammaproteobacteria bacterium]|nr:HIT family protein [Gammaproteobacteria bacterium]